MTVLLRDLKGLRYVARLLAEPGREFHVLDLVSVEAARYPPTPALVMPTSPSQMAVTPA